ncbi:PREDICTED: protein kintoun isoform X1 [Eufriesea mexicana]|uniref:protein kintoun isoform X1 n=1 Tax=Eufriesea mexicana TaxID=516756 RepID=UPI00083C3884|nr:PREDICTED: protein kintoun isoform X1 [Eufriesea mexicana]
MDAYETHRKSWEDLDVTKEELKNLTECLKKEEFRKLLIEYAEEVTDPENRKIYEKEITQLEKERGVDVTFVNPEPGYVIKTSVNGDKKCFLNISKSDIVGRPSSQPSFKLGHRGLQWSIPYTLIPPRDDLDKKNVRCKVFDVVFHPDTIYLTSKNAQFREIVNNTAMDGVESNFNVKLDRKNLKFPKMNYKGICHPTVIRKASKEPPTKQLDIEPEIYQKLMSSYDDSRKQQFKHLEKMPKRCSPPTTYYNKNADKDTDTNSKYVTPKFSIKHQSDIELEDFSTSRNAKMNATVPKRLIVNIDLPLLRTATDASLDVQECFLSIKSEQPAKYLLELPLPYHVNADMGNAKFDPKYKKLTITLPVIQPVVSVSDAREDSGVDSDHSSPVPLLLDESTEVSLSQNHETNPISKFVEECETVVAVTKVGYKSETLEDSSDTALRTSTKNIDTFLDPSITYLLPMFTCNIYNNQLAITVNVKNVDPNSIRHRILQNDLGIHILLTSIGAGFFPQYYSLYLTISENSVHPDSLTIEPWDNNVVFTIMLKNVEDLARYYVGINDTFMEEKEFPTATSFNDQLKKLITAEDDDFETDRAVDVQAEDDGVVINIRSNHLDSDDEAERHSIESTDERPNHCHTLSKSRSVSESSGDEITCNNIATGTYSKGILKSRRTHTFSRSVSESSADENGMVASSIDCHYDSIQDLNSESDCSSLKKTVRFNDVVSRQLFRSNSSILGQRKKNQRKLRNKRRAHERRMSESENSETEERDKYKANQKNAEVCETVKPILNKDRQIPQQKTANIEIVKASSNNRSLPERKSDIEEDIVNESHSSSSNEPAKDAVKAQFKNDLIFDLDM